jgi:hypothetical protein
MEDDKGGGDPPSRDTSLVNTLKDGELTDTITEVEDTAESSMEEGSMNDGPTQGEGMIPLKG